MQLKVVEWKLHGGHQVRQRRAAFVEATSHLNFDPFASEALRMRFLSKEARVFELSTSLFERRLRRRVEFSWRFFRNT